MEKEQYIDVNFSRQVLREFEIPHEDLCYHEAKGDIAIDET